MGKKKLNKCKWSSYIVVIYLIGLACLVGFRIFSGPQLTLPQSKISLIIPANATLDFVIQELKQKKVSFDSAKFRTTAQFLSYKNVKSGHYLLKKGLTYRSLINKLKLGKQDPVNLVISGNIQTKEKLSGILAAQLESDSLTWLNLLQNKSVLDPLGFTELNSVLLFLPNTYNVYWNRVPQRLFEDMKGQYDRFWNAQRTEQLKHVGLTKDQVLILASIVISESQKSSEMPIIAGVYLNRMKVRMPLQADPTIKFALGDFGLRRILNIHLEIDSPYNTYKNLGLPPGPICIPSIVSIDAVLNFDQHDYLYFCAKDDLSGAHAFAKTLQQHNVNAQAYRSALNKRKIFQ